MLYDRNDKLPRLEFCRERAIDPDTEARARQQHWEWPPFIQIGNRIFYSRQRTQEWFEQQERRSQAAMAGDGP